MYKIEYTKKARLNLLWIAEFIWNNNYLKVISSIKNIISLLEVNPEMWVELKNTEREIIEPKYKYQIRYAIIWKEIYILLIYKYKNIKWK